MNNCYVYTHTRLDSNTIFYVGIGTHKARKTKHSRANERTKRTKHWKNIVAKTDYSIEIVHDDITWEQACKIEMQLIDLYKRNIDGGTLCNLTLGGEGRYGLKHSAETIKKMSDFAKGKIISTSQREKARLNALGNKNTLGYKRSKEFKLKCSIAQTGKKLSEETKQKIGDFNRGKKRSAEICLKISKANKGKTIPVETREKIRNTLLEKSYIPSKTHVKVINTKTGKIFDTIKEAANSIGMKRTTLYMQLIGKNRSSTDFKLV